MPCPHLAHLPSVICTVPCVMCTTQFHASCVFCSHLTDHISCSLFFLGQIPNKFESANTVITFGLTLRECNQERTINTKLAFRIYCIKVRVALTNYVNAYSLSGNQHPNCPVSVCRASTLGFKLRLLQITRAGHRHSQG